MSVNRKFISLTGSTLVLLSLLVGVPARALDVTIAPYLQLMAPDGVTVLWELDGEAPGELRWGSSGNLDNQASAVSRAIGGGGIQYEVRLEGLTPGQTYDYQARAGAWEGEVRSFRTPDLPEARAGLRLVAMSDMQRDGAHPRKFEEMVNEGVLGWIESEFDQPARDVLDMLLFPGDLVQDGRVYSDWTDDFFDSAAPLIGEVPVYPALGNHEHNAQFYFDYFRFPTNNSTHFEGHWWSFDQANVRIIGLDSNELFRLPPQIDWLEETLEEACYDDSIDFVFAQFHHPAESELWPVGEAGFSRVVVGMLEDFSTECGKPSIHFFGHTHAYARGTSRDHNHLWINVASGGGGLDDWEGNATFDYENTTITLEEYGFVVLEVDPGDDRGFTMTRYGRGTPGDIQDNVIRDRVRISDRNRAPLRPRPLGPAGAGVAGECATLAVTGIPDDPDGDPIRSSHWQVSDDCEAFSNILSERWVQDQNVFFREDLNAGIDLTQAVVRDLPPNSELCWRVRFRDDGLAWSRWSVAVPFRTNSSDRGDNLLLNPGAEDRLSEYWVGEHLEMRTDGECRSTYPAVGRRYFAPAGSCGGAALGSATQEVDLSDLAAAIDAGDRAAFVRALGSTSNGTGYAAVSIRFVNDEGDVSDPVEALHFEAPRWERKDLQIDIPVGTRGIIYEMISRRSESGSAGFLDELELRIEAQGVIDCQARGNGEVPPDPVDPPEGEGGEGDVGGGSDAGGDAGGGIGVDPDASADVTDSADAAGDAGEVGEDDVRLGGGCGGCSSTPGAGGSPMALMLLAGVATLIRRRRA